MTGVSHIVLLIAISTVCATYAQTRPIIPKAKLDSLANPVAYAGSPMHFLNSSIDIGSLNEDDKPVTVSFEWTNIGDRDVRISEVKTGCDCTTVDYSREAVSPGENSLISVTYHPKGHPGSFKRKIVVKLASTGNENAAVLTLKGDVTSSQRPTHNYPYSMGSLLLKQKEISMDPSKLAVEKIEVMNSGDRQLKIKADGKLLPPCLSLQCIPAIIEPDGIADLEISYDPSKAKGPMPESLPIILEGLNQPVNMRTLYVRFKK